MCAFEGKKYVVPQPPQLAYPPTTQRISSLLKRTLVHFGNPPKVSILEVLISILEVLISILIGYSFHFGNGIHLIWKWYPLDLEMVST